VTMPHRAFVPARLRPGRAIVATYATIDTVAESPVFVCWGPT